MGVNMSGVSVCRRGSKEQRSTAQPLAIGNPDPRRFTVERVQQVGPDLVAAVRYHGVLNFEGLKVMLFLGVTESELRAESELDPHFCDHGHMTPFARFRPTDAGWSAAVALAKLTSSAAAAQV